MKINAVNCINHTRNAYPACSFGKSFSFPYNNEVPKGMSINDFEVMYEKKFFDDLCEMKDEIYSHLDSVVFDNGMTAQELLGSMFDMNSAEMSSKKLLHKTGLTNCPDILQNGFNPLKICITEFGPGFYFGFSEGPLSIYLGETLQAKYEGNTVQTNNLKDYNKISGTIKNYLMCDYLGIQGNFPFFLAMRAYNAINKFVNEYARHVISDKLGIDGALATGSDNYFVVFNPKAIKEVNMYRRNS